MNRKLALAAVPAVLLWLTTPTGTAIAQTPDKENGPAVLRMYTDYV